MGTSRACNRQSAIKRSLLFTTAAAAVAFITCILLAGCAEPPLPSTPDIRGQIEAIGKSTSEKDLGSILVNGGLEKNSMIGRASVTIMKDTEIFRKQGGKLVKADFEELAEGETVEAWFTGPVTESFPVMAAAQRVVIQ